MNSRETVERTLNFQYPERLGLSYFHSGQWNDDIFGGTVAGMGLRTNQRIEDNLELWEDEWHNTWARVATDKTTKGEVHRGAIEEWDQLDSYQLPDLANPALFEALRPQFAQWRERYRLAVLPGFCFSLARKLRRLELFLMDIKLEPERVNDMLGRIEDLLAKMIVQYARSGADGVFFAEDWGTQERLMISPADWQKFFKPSFARLCRLARENHLTVWMHSCGYIYEIIPHLIEVGINVLQLDQPELMGIERLGREFGGRVTFWSPCDIQKVLPSGDPRLIEDSVRRMAQFWGVNGGGLLGKSYGGSNDDLESIGVKPEWSEFAYPR